MVNKGYERRKKKRLAFFIKTAKKFGIFVYKNGTPAAAVYKLPIEKAKMFEKIVFKNKAA